jgi:predicted transcriptional regulator
MPENTTDSIADLIALAGDITIAWLQNPNVHPGAQDVPAFLKSMHAAITELGSNVAPEPEAVAYEPAVSVRSSVKPDHLISLIDGKKYKTLKRHLSINGLTPAEYRARYGLKSDYPMVAESYAAQRREIAKKLGLGRKPALQTDAPQTVAVEAVKEAPASAPATPKRTAGSAKGVAVTETVTPVAAKPKASARKSATVVKDPTTVGELDVPPVPAEPKRSTRKAKVQNEPETVTPPVIAETKLTAKSKRMARPPVAEASAHGDAAPSMTPDSETVTKPKQAPTKAKVGTAEKGAAKSAKPASAKKAKAKADAYVNSGATQTETSEA